MCYIFVLLIVKIEGNSQERENNAEVINLDLLVTDGFPENISLCIKDNLGKFHETSVGSIYFQ